MAHVNKGIILPIYIEDEMKNSYIDYAMSVIVGRALPDVRDGLKPVHRRILYGMKERGWVHERPYVKSAKIVGEVIGNYHPHGDAAVYDSLVRMVQDFSLRYPLIDGQGNFGSIDGDPPAAYRYTEARLAMVAAEMLRDIDKGTVGFSPTFDGSMVEPVVLPSALPSLLVNGSSGIAVGMATNIPPHNLSEVVDALICMIDEPGVELGELMKIVKGPDFPQGALIFGKQGIKDAYTTGRGSIKIRAKVDIEEASGNKERIIVRELPYQVNKAQLLETIANLVRNKKVEGISDLRDESDRDGTRVMIELKRDANSQVILNQLFKHTQLETSFGIIMLALVKNRPQVLGLKEILYHYIEHRKEVITLRTKYELAKAEARAHILEGLRIALENLNKVIKTIRASKTVDIAREELMKQFKLSREQAQAILDMRLHQLTGLEIEKIEKEYLELIKQIAMLKTILETPKKLMNIIKEDLLYVKDKYGDARRTKIMARAVEVDIEDLIKEEDAVVTISHQGYIKRLPATTYRSQHRGGRGITGVVTKEEDFIEDIFITSTHNYMLFFSNLGRVYWQKVYEIPEASRQSKGKAIVNLINLSSRDERINAAISVQGFDKEDSFLLMATKLGVIKKTHLADYGNPRKGGIRAINLDEGDSLIGVKMTDGKEEIIIGTRNGIAIHFKEEEVRPIGRTGKGVRGIRIGKDDEVVGMEVIRGKETFLTATELGYGKRTSADKYRMQARGGKGVINIKAGPRNGFVIGIKRVSDNDDIVLMTAKGIVIRQPVKDISSIGRNTLGVRLIRLEPQDKLVSISRLNPEDPGKEENS
ncbi:MAG: DNA gyrase subunit A [bacterium]